MHRLVLILLVACSDPPKPKQPASATPVAAPVIADAAVPTVPVDAGPLSLAPPVWPDANGPAGPITFKRDFKKPGSWNYDYRQNMTLTGGVVGGMNASEMRATGTIAIESKRDGTALVRLVANMSAQDVGKPASTHSGPVTMEFPLAETGLASAKDDQAAVLALLLPIPGKPMKVGDSEAVPFSLPVQGIPGMTSVAAPLELKLVGHSKLAGRTCARFDARLAIDKKQGAAHVTFALTGRYCLDPADGAVVASFLAMDMRIVNAATDMSIAGALGLDRI